MFLSACTSRDATILDSLRGRRNLPDLGPALSGNGNLQAWLVDAQTVVGYNQEFAFRSDFDLLDLAAFTQGIEPGDTVPEEAYVLRQFEEDGFLVIAESYDYGLNFRNWLRLPLENLSPQPSYEGFWFDGVQSGWYFVWQDRLPTDPPNFEPRLELFRVQGATPQVVARMDWPEQRVAELRFSSGGTGWVLLQPRAAAERDTWSVSHTADGGQTWSAPAVLPVTAEAQPRLAVSDQAAAVAFPNQPQVWSLKREETDWQVRDLSGALNLVLAAEGDRVLFAAAQLSEDAHGTVAELWRSENGGQDWEQVSDRRLYADVMRFLPGNPNLGLAFSQDVLQLTRDRGQTWELLAFPL